MIKLILGFAVIAGLTFYLLTKGGDIDMSGEKHGVDTHEAAPKAALGASAPAASAPAAAASAPEAKK